MLETRQLFVPLTRLLTGGDLSENPGVKIGTVTGILILTDPTSGANTTQDGVLSNLSSQADVSTLLASINSQGMSTSTLFAQRVRPEAAEQIKTLLLSMNHTHLLELDESFLGIFPNLEHDCLLLSKADLSHLSKISLQTFGISHVIERYVPSGPMDDVKQIVQIMFDLAQNKKLQKLCPAMTISFVEFSELN